MPVSPFHKRLTRPGQAFLLLGAGAGAAWLAVRAREARQRRRARSAPQLPVSPTPARRLLVIAPHPDDETLALGGLIHQAIREGVDVRIVFLTSGDGFALCGALHSRGWPHARRMRDLARLREEEARAAARALGVPPEHVRFLGYPDRGLADLWLTHWSPERPYRSPHTGRRRAHSGEPYCGEALARELGDLLAELTPDHVYYPDSLDDHPDHWAAHCFTRMALVWGIPAATPVERTYLVHRGEWPQPLGEDRSLFLAPPAETRSLPITWESQPLDDAALAAKSAALAAHRTQLPLVGNFLRAFLRRNELLAEWHHPGSGFYPDARRDRPARQLCGGLDLAALEVDRRSSGASLRARLRGEPVPGITYSLAWAPLHAPEERSGARVRSFRGPAARRMEVPLPAEDPSWGDLLVAAFIRSGGVIWDRSPWYRVPAPEWVGSVEVEASGDTE